VKLPENWQAVENRRVPGSEYCITAQHPTRPDARYTLATLEGFTREESENAANLMAAAPDLLKQLKALVVQIKASGLIVPPNVTAAIDKAEGRA
jgi:hypothetical protein